jgi:hypothetical protein
VKTNQPTFQVAIDSSTALDGQATEQDMTVWVYDVNGLLVGTCQAQPAGAGIASCALASPLPDGTYRWKASFYVHACVSVSSGAPICSTVYSPSGGPLQSFSIATDATPPRVHAVAGAARVGRPSHILFTASDNSGYATLALTISSATRVVWRTTYNRSPVQSGRTYQATWTPPRVGAFTFCIGAVDAAGNESNPSCARLTVTA